MSETTIKISAFALWLACVAPVETPVDIWRAKLTHLETARATTSHPSIAFDLDHEIGQIRGRLRDSGRCCCGDGCQCKGGGQ